MANFAVVFLGLGSVPFELRFFFLVVIEGMLEVNVCELEFFIHGTAHIVLLNCLNMMYLFVAQDKGIRPVVFIPVENRHY